MKKMEHFIKHNAVFFFLYRLFFGFIFRFLGCFVKTNKKLILFVSYGGDSFNDSPKALFDYIKDDGFFSSYFFVWALKKPILIEGAKVVKIDSFKYFITALKAGIWITNVNIERGLRFKKKKTIYLNTWHGTGPKKSGRAIKDRKDYDFSNVDILCVDGKYTKDHFIEYFNAKEESMIWCGRPREDRLFNFSQSDVKNIKAKLKIPNDKKVIFYAPTWREKHTKLLDINTFKSILGENYFIIVRSHHFSNDDFSRLNGNFANVTDYPDISDLYLISDYLISDYLISDYSSAFFDFGLLKKPFYCFATDYDAYQKDVGLFIDIKEEFVGGVFTDEKELALRILDSDYLIESEQCYKVCHKYVEVHDNSTFCCVEKLKYLIKNKIISNMEGVVVKE